MNKKTFSIAVGALVLAGVACTAGPALATDAPVSTPAPYVLAAWQLGPLSRTSNAFADDQHIITSAQQGTTDLNALDAILKDPKYCGITVQIDLYLNDSTTTALIAGGVLHAPNNPVEHLAPVPSGSPWKYITTDACVAPTPTPTPTPTVTPTTTPTPVVTVDTKPSTSAAPTLAFTGQTKAEAVAAKQYYETGYIGFGALIAAGIAMVLFGLYGRRKNKREEQNV